MTLGRKSSNIRDESIGRYDTGRLEQGLPEMLVPDMTIRKWAVLRVSNVRNVNMKARWSRMERVKLKGGRDR